MTLSLVMIDTNIFLLYENLVILEIKVKKVEVMSKNELKSDILFVSFLKLKFTPLF